MGFCFTPINPHRNMVRVFCSADVCSTKLHLCLFFFAVALKRQLMAFSCGGAGVKRVPAMQHECIRLHGCSGSGAPSHPESECPAHFHNQNIHGEGAGLLGGPCLPTPHPRGIRLKGASPSSGDGCRMRAERSWQRPPCLFRCFRSAVTKTLHNG